MFLCFSFLMLLGFLCDVIQGDFVCSCGNSGGCNTGSRCWPSATNCLKENVALGKMAAMSSTYSGGDGTSGLACLAVNGNRSHTIGLIQRGFRNGLNCIHTAPERLNPYWSVDLGRNFTISEITIYNRNENPGNLNNAVVRVDEQPCATIIIYGNSLIRNVTCRTPIRGQTVKLTKRNDFFNFCELEVWVCSAGRYDPECEKLCEGTCKNNETCDNYYGTCPDGCKQGLYGDFCNKSCGHCKNIVCDQQTGHCLSGCEAGWKSPTCTQRDFLCSCENSSGCDTDDRCWPDATNCLKENVALGKMAVMSSTYSADEGTSGPACLAVNGNRSHTIGLMKRGSHNILNCIHTAPGSRDPLYWSVDLGRNFTVSEIKIYNRNVNTGNLNSAVVRVNNQYCTTLRTAENSLIHNVTCRTPVRGQTVALTKRNGFFNFCELEVWVCSAGRYGPECDKLCGGNCRNNNKTCDNYYGTCLNGCRDGLYGDFCNQSCGHCQNIVCDQKTGHCLSGCEAGWQPPACLRQCRRGFYGPDCNYACGNCSPNNSTCNITTGQCDGGCQPGYIAPYCMKTCVQGFYGDDCNHTCGSCTEGTTCHHVSGVCPSGCQSGFWEPNCNKTCLPGSYGRNCQLSCGQCRNGNSTCNISTGVCENGCQPGYTTSHCNQSCPRGSYGDGCGHTCGNCSDGTCEPVSGVCPSGCRSGYQQPLCTETCTNGSYGMNCNDTCGRCSAGTACDPTTGVCPDGCQTGYQRPLCQKKCSRGYYGDNCNLTCGQCSEETCRYDTGVCSSGCQSGYQGVFCNDLMQDKGPGVAVGAVVGVVIILILIGVVIFFLIRYKRHRNRKPEPVCTGDRRHSNAELMSSSSAPSISFKRLAKMQSPNAENSKLRSRVDPTVKASWTCGNGPMDQAVDDNIYMNTAPSSTTTVHPSASSRSLGNYFGEEATEQEDPHDNVYNNDSVYASFKASSPQLDAVQRSLVDILASDELPEQFKQLPEGLTDSHEVAKLQQNRKKNRYNSVLPYDHNRVTLNDGYREGTSTDYVNASYISGFRHEKKYIASQGPRIHTVGDFWRMVWQENVSQIVMLTNTIEGGQDKCAEYWPAQSRTVTYGPVTVTGVEVKQRASFVVRSFILKRSDDREEREVEQYHYLAWPDHGTPTTTSLLNFWRFAMARAPHSPSPPVLVHCTAGVGRTGTYIGLDIAFDEAVGKGDVNVLNIVKGMRKDRCIMVQTLGQYVFLHKVLLEAYTGRNTSFPNYKLETVFLEPVRARRQNPAIDAEFQRALQMKSLTSGLTYNAAKEKENIEKNRNPNALPSDEHRVFLTAHVPERNQYINAVFMSAYFANRGSILTQLPLANTVVDFWRLVDGNDVTTIVSLGSLREVKTKDFCQYWPAEKTRTIQAEPYLVSLRSTSRLASHLDLFDLSVEKKGSRVKREIRLARFQGWPDEIPADTSEVLTLINFVDTRRQMEEDSSPVIIQCPDGVTKSGLFSVLCDVISRLKYDKEIDVYMATRELHNIRPEALTSVVQYRYCYEVAQHRLSETSVYANAS